MSQCQICNNRKARRACPAIGGLICPQCCATDREEKLDCPYECGYLAESREHSKERALPDPFPNSDIRLSEEVIAKIDNLAALLLYETGVAAKADPAMLDSDAGEAIEAIIKTYRTARTGLIYESRAGNPYAARLQDRLTAAVRELDTRYQQAQAHPIPESMLLASFVFMQRLLLSVQNSRSRGRAFLHHVRSLSVDSDRATRLG